MTRKLKLANVTLSRVFVFFARVWEWVNAASDMYEISFHIRAHMRTFDNSNGGLCWISNYLTIRFVIMCIFLLQSLLLLLLAINSVLGGTQYTQDDIDSGKALTELSKIALHNALSRLENSTSSTCNKNNVKVYKEWCVFSGNGKF